MKLFWSLFCYVSLFASTGAIPVALLYEQNIPEAVRLPREDDVSSPEVRLRVPVVFYGTRYDSIFINSNGLISFQTEIPNFFNVEFPLTYALIAPFYSNVDTRAAGSVSYYETNNQQRLRRATGNVRDFFSDDGDFQATSLVVVTWFGVGYYNQGSDKINTYQVAIATDGNRTFVELLYPQGGIQWIQGTRDESGLPNARAQAGFISDDGRMYTLPGSGTEQVRNLEILSNINLVGQFIYRVDEEDIIHPDITNDGVPNSAPLTCAQAPTYCHIQASCQDYDDGFCCKCKKQYYGNGKFCIKKDAPLRVNGKVDGNINGERFTGLDLQSYIVMTDGRAYTAISKIPESIGHDIQTLQVLGGIIGYLFAKPVHKAPNGYQLTGGVFNYTATINFLNTNQSVVVKEKYLGLDVFDQLRLEAHIQGAIPNLPQNATVIVDEYQEEYTVTSSGVIQTSSVRKIKYGNENGQETTLHYAIEQILLFDYCKYENNSVGETWKLKVGKNFVSYEEREQIIRFALGNKVAPLGNIDPCEEGRSQCGPNSACVVDNESFRCVCNPGYHYINSGNATWCADIDECQSGIHNCDYNAQCQNQIGTFSCHCNPGFEGDGYVCVNAATCDRVRCPSDAECKELGNIAVCRCLPGFTGDGYDCSPIADHSCHSFNNCAKFGICTIDSRTNSYYCSCLPGYTGDGYTCNKIPEQVTTTEQNTEHSTNTEYSTESTTMGLPLKEVKRCLLGVCWCSPGYVYESGTPYCILQNTTETPEPSDNERPEVQCYNASLCFCPRGFTLANNSCVVNQNFVTKGSSGFNITCNTLNNCHREASCIYSVETDSYFCECNHEYEGDGYDCQPVSVSCTILNNCNAHATCAYDQTLGKSKCVCNPGYEGDGFTCKIKAICTSNSDCSITEECHFTNANRYECVCKDGHVRDSQSQCVKSSTTCGGGTCVENAECLYDEEYQIDYCSCKTGYYGDGIIECKLRPIGCNVLNNCGLHATCEYDHTTSLYQCKCDKGFYGDGFVCYTEINCHVDPTLCDQHASCVTDANRRYICQCNTGFIGNGSICKQNPTHEGNFLLLNQGMATLKIPFEPSKRNLGKPIQIGQFQTAVGLDIDCYEGRVYWGDIIGRAIRSSTYNGSDKSDFLSIGVGSPEGIAVDWVSRNIYWTDSINKTIEVATIEGKRRRIIFNTGLFNPRGIVVHPQRGKIFWTDWNRKQPKIEWANADGTNRETFLQGETVSLPNSLAIDYDTENLCYTDAGTKKIECVQIDTKSRQTIATNCTYPFGITVTDTHIYWSDWISKKIERVEKNTLARLSPLQVPLGGSGNKLYGLVAVPERCPILTNVCQSYKVQCPADHICLPNGSGSRTCACTSAHDNPPKEPGCVL